MKTFTDDAQVAKKKKLASIITPVAMVALVGGLATNFLSIDGETASPTYIGLTIALLAIGFIAATVSAHLVNHWVKEPRPDQVLEKALKGFDNQTFLFNYTSSVPHVLLTQDKVYSITPKIVNGEISVNERKWSRKFKLSRLLRFFGEEGLGNPTAEAENHRSKLAKLIETQMPDDEPIPVEPIIVFTDPKAELTINNSTIPVVPSSRLKKYIRQESKGQAISHESRQEIIALLKNGTE